MDFVIVDQFLLLLFSFWGALFGGVFGSCVVGRATWVASLLNEMGFTLSPHNGIYCSF
jgi:hypothetical protein